MAENKQILNGVVTWLKGWFYDKTEITGFLNNKANQSDLNTTNGNITNIQSSLENKVDKVDGKGLSTNDFTSAYKTKLDNLDTNLSSKNVTVEKLTTAETGFLASYVVKQNGAQVGNSINIPKDYLVKSGSVKTVTTANQPVNSYKVGDKYIDLVINTKTSDGTDEHLYILVSDLVSEDISWDDIQNKPSNFPPSIHQHATIYSNQLNTNDHLLVITPNNERVNLGNMLYKFDINKSDKIHNHGNITEDGKVGNIATKPLITGAGGVVQAGSFGTTAGTFCQGNDSRLSDARTPKAHQHSQSDITDLGAVLLTKLDVSTAENTFATLTDVIDWSYTNNTSGFVNGIRLVPKSEDDTGTIEFMMNS